MDSLQVNVLSLTSRLATCNFCKGKLLATVENTNVWLIMQRKLVEVVQFTPHIPFISTPTLINQASIRSLIIINIGLIPIPLLHQLQQKIWLIKQFLIN
jgi:hypothetical protein